MKEVSLVTGASSGLGKNIAKLLCEKGHIVYITARRKDQLLELKKECLGDIRVIDGDLSNKLFRENLVSKIIKTEGRLDYLINNAGFGTAIKFVMQPVEDIENMFNVNVISMMHLTNLVLPYMIKKNKGKIINISSIVTITPLPYFAVYDSTKAAVSNFTRALTYELKKTNVNCSVVMPSRMKTGFAKIAFKCNMMDPKAHKKCMNDWDKMAGSSMDVAKYIVKKLNSKKLVILPNFKTRLLYFSKHFSYFVDWGINKFVEPNLRPHIKNKIHKDYYKK